MGREGDLALEKASQIGQQTVAKFRDSIDGMMTQQAIVQQSIMTFLHHPTTANTRTHTCQGHPLRAFTAPEWHPLKLDSRYEEKTDLELGRSAGKRHQCAQL